MTASSIRKGILLLTAVAASLAVAAPSRPAAQKLDAAAMLTDARNALGGDAKIRGLKALRLTGSTWSSQSVIGGRVQVLETPMEVRIAFPNRFVHISVVPFGSGESRNGFAGERVISTMNGRPMSGGRSTRAAAELFLLLLARTESWSGLVLDAVGPNTIQVRGPNAYTARLEVDPASRLPSRLIYRERRQIRHPTSPPSGSVGQASGGGGSARSSGDLPEIEMMVTPHDRRAVDGLLLPTRITTSAQGVDLWEHRFEQILVNPPLTAADFAP